MRRWKARRGDGSSKVHTAKLSQYLQVWDLREGWTNGGYDRSRERSFAAIARRLKKPLSTVPTHYRTAFEFIVGHAFSPGLWWRLFGPLKFSRLIGDATAAYSAGTRRRLQSPVARPLPDSVVSPAGDAARTSSTVERGSAVVDNAAYTDLLIDLQDLIARGLSDGEIARRLDLDDPLLVAAFRRESEALQHVSPQPGRKEVRPGHPIGVARRRTVHDFPQTGVGAGWQPDSPTRAARRPAPSWPPPFVTPCYAREGPLFAWSMRARRGGSGARGQLGRSREDAAGRSRSTRNCGRYWRRYLTTPTASCSTGRPVAG